MNCPLCGKKCMVTGYESSSSKDGLSFICPVSVYSEELEREIPHYTKDCSWGPFCEERAILLPYRLSNVYINDEYRKPYCQIDKLKLINTPWGKKFRWSEILFLNYPVEIIKYKKMRNRINNLILFS